MPICIECRYPLKTLYTTYSKADDRALGKGVRLTQCPRCKRFADKYVEHDFVVLFIDLVLIKPQVYRHLLFNRLGREDDRFDPSIIRLGILLLLFDVYLTWARIEKASPDETYQPSHLSSQPLVLQYMFFLCLCSAQTLAFHFPIRLLCRYAPRITIPSLAPLSTTAPSNPSPTAPTSTPPPPPPSPTPQPTTLLPHYPHPTPLSTALLVSSCTKLFPLLLIIWDYDLPSSATAVSWAVIVNNVAALEILMDCGYLRAGLLVAVGAACRAAVGGVVLRCAGLEGRTGVGGLGLGMGLGGLWG
ncbi:Arv1-like protein [Saccharata proteae CBS 121410]|uniref:Protein ARV n=1 Tax=Saccharata proteae CBS 121410 TaxID=1314787 RepID=A0A9P4M3R1_9PEZI|nr:Arv1-like protein [Saccharata proteae CBS 121410]